jgi:NADPH-dependent glutamate synthase beta subunit-like oxidoreductase
VLPSMIYGLCRLVPNEPSGMEQGDWIGATSEGYKKAPAGEAWRRCSSSRRVCFVRSIAVNSCTCASALASDAFRIVLRGIIATAMANCYTIVKAQGAAACLGGTFR